MINLLKLVRLVLALKAFQVFILVVESRLYPDSLLQKLVFDLARSLQIEFGDVFKQLFVLVDEG